MNRTKRRLYMALLKLFNLGLMVVAFGAATILQLHEHGGGLPLVALLSVRVKLINFVIFCLILLAWHWMFSLFGQYCSQRLAERWTMISDSAKAISLASVLLVVAARFWDISLVTPMFMVSFWICAFILVAGSRMLIRSGLEMVRRRGRNLRYILILGTNRRAVEFARRIEAKSEWGYRILGFVDNEWHDKGGPELRHPLCCNFESLAAYLRHNVVDEVANYLPLRSFYERASHIATLCEQHGILLRFDPLIFDLKIARARTEELDGDAHITSHSSLLDSWATLLKRALDVVVSVVLLVVFAPVLAAIAVLVKLTSKGPVMFRQERIGINKRRFFIYKFRTMVPNAEKLLPRLEQLNEASGPVFKIKNDPRTTPVGRMLRRTSLDELPQLFNVLRGDMSLVGPRPLPVRDYHGFNEDWQRRRFSVRPGITCLWQVSGRSGIGFDRWMELDLQYLDEWSIWLDVKILAQTIPAVLRGSGAA